MIANTLDHARLYLGLGFALIPMHFPIAQEGPRGCSCAQKDCGQPGKHPFGKLAPHGINDASRDPATVERWFKDTKLNIGIATGAFSDIVVLDVDPRHDGETTLAALELQNGTLPLTWRFLTGGGGEHILFRHPGGVIPNSAGAIGPGLDIRADGGCIVAPPSRHACGRIYAISVDHHPEDVPLAELPEWLLGKITTNISSKTLAGAGLRTLTRNVVVEGGRNITIARLSGHLLGKRIDSHMTLDLVLAFNATHCRPPLPEHEVVRCVASIAQREYAKRVKRRKAVANG